MPKPHISVQIDFDEDGLFQTDEEIVSDVQEAVIVSGWDTQHRHAISGYCDLTLKNFDHKYSPSYVGSSLYPFQLPGPQMRVRAAYPYDDLSGVANGTDLDTRLLSVGGAEGFAWEADDGATNVWETANSGRIAAAEGSGAGPCVVDFGTPNVKLGFKLHKDDPTPTYELEHSIATFRYADSNNHIFVTYHQTSASDDPDLRLYRRIGGTETVYGTTLKIGNWEANFLDEIWFYFEFKDKELYVYADPSIGIETTFPEIALESSPSSMTLGYLGKWTLGSEVDSLDANTKHGIGGGGGGVPRVEDRDAYQWEFFGGWSALFTGRIDRVEPVITNTRKYAYIRAYDDFERLSRWRAFSGILTFPATFEDIGKAILQQGGYADAKNAAKFGDTFMLRSARIDAAGTTLLQEDARALSRDTASLLRQLEDDEVGRIYFNGHGIPVLEAGNARDSGHQALWGGLATWSATVNKGDIYLAEPFEWDDGKRNTENQVFYTYFKNSASITDAEIWRLQGLLGDRPEWPQADSVAGSHSLSPSSGATAWGLASEAAKLAVPYNEALQRFYTSYTKMDFAVLTDVDVSQDVFGGVNPPLPGTDLRVWENVGGTGQEWTEQLYSNVGTVSISTSPDYVLTDTGATFTGTHTWTTDGGSTSKTSGKFIIITDNSGRRAVAYAQAHDSSPTTKLFLQSFPYNEDLGGSVFYGDGYLYKHPNFSEADTPLTYTVRAVCGWYRPAYDGDGMLLQLLGISEISAPNYSAGARTAYVHTLIVKGDKYTPSIPASARAEDSDSQLANGRRRYENNALFIDRWETASDRASRRLQVRREAREVQGFTIKAAGPGRNVQELLYRDPGDRVRVIFDAMSSDRDVFIELRKLQWSGGDALSLTASYKAERIPGSDGGHEGVNYFYDGSNAYFGVVKVND